MSEKKKVVLVADDEEDIKAVIGMFLETQGYEVVTSYDGLDTLERAREIKPDVILMDIMMPVVDGIEATRQLKASAETRDIPVIMLTAAAQSEMVRKAMQAGAFDYISKPFEPEQVQEAIQRSLTKK